MEKKAGESISHTTKVVVAYVGSIAPDQSPFNERPFNRAGNMFQENLLLAIEQAGLPISIILSQRSLRAFPNSSTLRVGSGQAALAGGLWVKFMPFLNLPVLRPLTVGLAVVINLIRWSWQQREPAHKIVYTFNLTEPPGLFTLISARLIGAKVVASLNDIYIPGELVPGTFVRRLDFWLQKKLIPHLDGLVVVNRRIIEDFAPNKPFVRIEGAINEVFFHRDHSDSHHSNEAEAPFIIASAGTLWEVNGINELLEAFALLPGHRYRLHIAGRGPLEAKVRQAAQLDPHIKYWGYLSYEEVLAFYADADVLINMRLTKTVKTDYFFPSKTIEYLASGTPVITTCTGHIEQEYAEFAFLLRDETPPALARMIEQVAALDLELRMQKGQAAREYIRTHNTWEIQGRRVVEFIYNEII